MFSEFDVPKQKLRFLNETFHCISPKYRPSLVDKTLSANPLGVKCKKEGICMWEMSSRFCREPFCESEKSLKTSKCRKKCKEFTTREKHELVENVCNNDVDAVAVKTIRLLS